VGPDEGRAALPYLPSHLAFRRSGAHPPLPNTVKTQAIYHKLGASSRAGRWNRLATRGSSVRIPCWRPSSETFSLAAISFDQGDAATGPLAEWNLAAFTERG
jgi:hypothetical protein